MARPPCEPYTSHACLRRRVNGARGTTLRYKVARLILTLLLPLTLQGCICRREEVEQCLEDLGGTKDADGNFIHTVSDCEYFSRYVKCFSDRGCCPDQYVLFDWAETKFLALGCSIDDLKCEVQGVQG